MSWLGYPARSGREAPDKNNPDAGIRADSHQLRRISNEDRYCDIERNSQKDQSCAICSKTWWTCYTRLLYKDSEYGVTQVAIQPCYTRLLTKRISCHCRVGSYKSFQAYLHLHTDMKSDNPVVIVEL